MIWRSMVSTTTASALAARKVRWYNLERVSAMPFMGNRMQVHCDLRNLAYIALTKRMKRVEFPLIAVRMMRNVHFARKG